MDHGQDLHYLSIGELGPMIESRRVSPVEVTEAYLERIRQLNPQIHSYITVMEEHSIAAARHAEQEIQRGRYLGPLHGVPIGLKDIIYTKGVPTTSGSLFLQDFVPSYDATVVEHLLEAGAIIMGKLNLHEFACGGADGNPFYGVTRNPWGHERYAGGSSGGSAAAVAAGLAAGALGTDTGGSVRLPANLCGTVGLKPTFGRVSRYGVTPLSWTLDHVGPLTRTVSDCALLLYVLAGHDPRDPYSASVPTPNYPDSIVASTKGLRVGVPRPFFFENVTTEVKDSVEHVIEIFEGLGAEVRDIPVAEVEHASNVYLAICYPEAASYHQQWFPQHLADYGSNTRERLEIGSVVPGSAYIEALKLQRALVHAFQTAFAEVDVLVAPVSPVVAHHLGESEIKMDESEWSFFTHRARLTQPANVAGLPSLAIPCGFSREGLPLGFQLIGRAFDESTLLRLGHTYQQATDWHTRHPVL